MKKFSALFFFVCAAFFASGQNGISCYTIPAAVFPTNATANYCKIAVDTNQNILICSKGAGLILFDQVNYTSYTKSNSGIASNYLIDIAVTTNNKYCIATDSSGLSIFDGSIWTSFDTSNSALVTNQITRVFTHGNKIYAGSNQGFSILENGAFTNYSVSNSALCNDTIYDFTVDNTGNLWIATKRGLSKFDGIAFSTIIANKAVTSLCSIDDYVWIRSGALYSYHLNVLSSPSSFSNLLFTFTPGKYLTKGPQGGIVMQSNIGLVELVGNEIYLYKIQGSCLLGFPSLPMVFNPADTSIWMKGNSKTFSKFKFSNYQPSWGAYIPSNWQYPSNFENIKALDVNQVKAAILNRGALFSNSSARIYEVPKGSGKHTMTCNSLWIAAKDQNHDLHTAADVYAGYSGADFWPGPLDTISGTTDSATAIQYDKIWKVDRFQIEQFKYYFQNGAVQNGSFIPAEDILTWPAQGSGNYTRRMAPFMDANQNGIYDPMTGGDYPLIKGDQLLYWITNDNLGIHTLSNGTALKIEIHGSAYSYACNNLANRDSLVNYTTFYNYRIFNRSSLSYDSCYIGNSTDLDIGSTADDKEGTNVPNNFVYGYNADSLDDYNSGSIFDGEYGRKPPIISCVTLNGPPAFLNDNLDNDNDGVTDEAGEKNLLTGSLAYEYHSFGPLGYTEAPSHFYNYLRTRLKNGAPATYGGNGTFGTIPVTHFYPDFPYDSSGWSRAFAADQGIMLSSCGPFSLAPGASIEYDFAFVFSRDTTLTYNSPAYYNMAVSDVQRVKAWFENNNAPSCLPIFPGITDYKKEEHSLLIFPNPASESVQISLPDNSLISTISLFDVSGKLVRTQAIYPPSTKSSFAIRQLNTGVYFIIAKDVKGKEFNAGFVKE